jgi:hypothetical protein
LLTALQPSDNLVVNAMHGGSEVLVGELGCTVAADDITIGSVADRCLLSGVKQTSHFEGVRTVFDPCRKLGALHSDERDTVEPLGHVRNVTLPVSRWGEQYSSRLLASFELQAAADYAFVADAGSKP